MDIRPIRDDADYEWALKEIKQYFDNEPARGTPEADRFDVLSALIGAYEGRVYPMPASSPADVLRFYMDQNGLTQADLARVIGSRSRASEIMSGSRSLSLAMIAAIRNAWRIPADLLVPVSDTVAAE
ncbi:helix-turn-helix domain-containing protein [Komagataeibacter medellinensis]|uniref:Helix-turn-helix domain-containing protein n=1 Tax=Komagataeibacter medellinensis TaxID=1177712 RepID=A0ABQ6VYU1_9PROT|nr:helix-turn-helix domain-containing protein [Komagataeibacter medellinensis]KAB8125385.1 helix-turn-helix domain-containing protein [Komagataeibacter medellinensis]